jgi:hypothetical protein
LDRLKGKKKINSVLFNPDWLTLKNVDQTVKKIISNIEDNLLLGFIIKKLDKII